MPKKRSSEPKLDKRKKVKKSHYFDADVWDRLQAFARSQEPVVTDSAVIDAALRNFLDEREGRRK